LCSEERVLQIKQK